MKKEQKVFECWTNSPKLQSKVLEDILEDGLYEVIYTVCSGYLVAATAKRKQDALLLTWLQEEVNAYLFLGGNKVFLKIMQIGGSMQLLLKMLKSKCYCEGSIDTIHQSNVR